jgi:hypothetical protein
MAHHLDVQGRKSELHLGVTDLEREYDEVKISTASNYNNNSITGSLGNRCPKVECVEDDEL